MIKRLISLLLLLVIAIMPLAACGGGGSDGDGTSENTDATTAGTAAITIPETETAAVTAPETSPVTSPETLPETTVAPEFFEGLNPALWRVTDGTGAELYLFGTIHVGDEHNDAALELVKPYLDECDALAVEFDAVAYQSDTARMTQDIMKLVYLDGTTVKNHMPQELYERVKQFLTERGQYAQLLEMYKIPMWSQLVQSALMEEGPLTAEKAMDSLLILYAYGKGLPVLDIESAALQYDAMVSIPDAFYVLDLEETLDAAGEYRDGLNDLYAAWCSGDTDALTSETSANVENDEYTAEEKEAIAVYENKMIYERNEGMVKTAVSYLRSGKKVFFAVGAAHMVGDRGIVKALEQAGCTVERISVSN